jgi:hypothetical protein
MLRTLLLLTTSVCLAIAAADEPTAPGAESLAKVLTDFDAAMVKGPTEARRKALAGILPEQRDLEALFGDKAALFWDSFATYRQRMIEHADEVAAELGRLEMTRIEAIDIRQDSHTKGFAAVLEIIPEDVPVFRAVRRGDRRSAGSSSYLFVNGRWIHVQGLEMIPNVIAHAQKTGK